MRKYLQRIGGIIHYGRASSIEILEKELFPKKFKFNNSTSTRYKWYTMYKCIIQGDYNYINYVY